MPNDEIADWEKILLLEQALATARADLAAAREQLAGLVEAWGNDGHSVMFNDAKDDLSPQQRVGKWLRAALAAVPDSTNAPAGEPPRSP